MHNTPRRVEDTIANQRQSIQINSAASGPELRARILSSLRSQGFSFNADGTLRPVSSDKDKLRALHATARAAAIERARPRLQRHENRLLGYFAEGSEIEPTKVRPRLHEIEPKSEEELLFRYARLHWSIPISAGYGRRLRFLVFDESNGKLIGLFGLGDPVFGLRPRDAWIGWTKDDRKKKLKHVMDAFLVGAVPPYSMLLCGKFIATLLASEEVREAFKSKYGGRNSLISNQHFDGNLALVTTTSALGRSSVYNRLTLEDGRRLLKSVGYSSGSGEFHFSNGIYEDLIEYASTHLQPSAKNPQWGSGWRNRREVIRRSLQDLGLPPDLMYHGVRREVFVAPLASNVREFLKGESQRLRFHRLTMDVLFDRFRERWLLPRAERDERYLAFTPQSLRLWYPNPMTLDSTV